MYQVHARFQAIACMVSGPNKSLFQAFSGFILCMRLQHAKVSVSGSVVETKYRSILASCTDFYHLFMVIQMRLPTTYSYLNRAKSRTSLSTRSFNSSSLRCIWKGGVHYSIQLPRLHAMLPIAFNLCYCYTSLLFSSAWYIY